MKKGTAIIVLSVMTVLSIVYANIETGFAMEQNARSIQLDEDLEKLMEKAKNTKKEAAVAMSKLNELKSELAACQ